MTVPLPSSAAWAAALSLGAALLGCAAGLGASQAVSARPASARDPVFALVIERFAGATLEADAIDPSAMLEGGLRELAPTTPGLSLQTDDFAHHLRRDGEAFDLPRRVDSLADLTVKLESAAHWIASASAPTEAQRLDLAAAALRGAVRAVDRWATVLSGNARKRFLDHQQGALEGIGCRIGLRGNGIEVLSVVPGAPADRADLRPGDRILAINGQTVGEDSVEAVTQSLRGPVDTQVRVQLSRPGVDAPIDLDLTRSRFATVTVTSRMLRPDLAYLRIEHIAKNSGAQAERVVGGLLDGTPPRGLVLDLRGNSGGSILAAAEIADLFVREGVLIETRGRGGVPAPGLRDRVDATDSGDRESAATAVVVLVDRGTASSAELLAAALARHDRALVVGERTYGKAIVQKTYDLGSGGALTLKVTVARSYAAGRPIPEQGLVPDVLVGNRSGSKPELLCRTPRDPDGGPFAVLTPRAEEDQDPALSLAVRLLDDYGTRNRRNTLDRLCDQPPLAGVARR